MGRARLGRLGAAAAAGGGAWWLLRRFKPAPERIEITAPVGGTTVASPVHVSGVGQAAQHNRLAVRVRDAAGQEIGTGHAAIAASLGRRGPFSGAVPFTGGSGPGRVEVYDVSPRDGHVIHLSSVEVTLA